MATVIRNETFGAPHGASHLTAAVVDPELTPVRQIRRMTRLIRFAEQVFDMLNPATPGKAEMRNCDDKRAAMLESRPRN